jgi:GTP-binding protein
LKISAEFITSAAGAADFPADGLPEVAMVGRSNVGKSSLINALLRQRVARTSAAPGKTRLANVYRVARGSAAPFYLVDLPGYGYARGGALAAREFEELSGAYFSRGIQPERGIERQPDLEHRSAAVRLKPDATTVAALLLVDTRHPGLTSDRAAWQWLQRTADRVALVGTKIDKLARGQRIRALRELESVFEDSVLPVSVVTGEGLDELWKLIDSLASNPNPINPRSSPLPKGTAPRRPKK